MTMKRSLGLVRVAVIAGLCLATSASAQDADPGQDAAWHNQQSLALARLRWQDGWRALPGGVKWRWLSGDGSRAHPAVTDTVSVHYSGSFIDGTEFDGNFGSAPATFPLRALIPAWQMAVPQMGIGDTIEIASPADYAYGPVGKGPIPGGATLFFKIELVGIRGKD